MLFLSDLDGTLIDDYNTVSDWAKKKLTKMMSEGMEFGIVTGRDLLGARIALADLKPTEHTILTNGAMMMDLETEELLEVRTMSAALGKAILDLSDIPVMVIAAYDTELHFLKGQWFPETIPLPRESYEKFIGITPIVSIQYVAQKEILEDLYLEIKAKYGEVVHVIFINVVSEEEGDVWWLEINPLTGGKANMAKTLLDMKGLTFDDLVFFGDNYNDIDLLKAAKYSFAVENAPDDVKKAAKEVIGTCKSGAVVNKIQEIWDSLRQIGDA